MADIGSFDAPPAPEETDDPVTITVAGEVFTLRRVPAVMSLLEYAKAAADGVTDASLEGRLAMMNFFEGVFPPEEYARFRSLCRRIDVPYSHPDPKVVSLMAVSSAVWKWLSDGRPTERPLHSEPSPSTAGESTEADVSSEAEAPVAQEARVVDLWKTA